MRLFVSNGCLQQRRPLPFRPCQDDREFCSDEWFCRSSEHCNAAGAGVGTMKQKMELFVRLSANQFIESMTDEDLVHRIYTGKEHAFAEIYYRYKSPIFRFAFHMIGSMSAAEDVMQEVFLTLLEFQKYNASKGPFAPYLFGIARHHVSRWMKKNQNYVSYSELD